MAKLNPPIGMCKKCGASIWGYELIKQHCSAIIEGKPCSGLYVKKDASDWEECRDCSAEGKIDGSSCTACRGDGWVSVKKDVLKASSLVRADDIETVDHVNPSSRPSL